MKCQFLIIRIVASEALLPLAFTTDSSQGYLEAHAAWQERAGPSHGPTSFSQSRVTMISLESYLVHQKQKKPMLFIFCQPSNILSERLQIPDLNKGKPKGACCPAKPASQASQPESQPESQPGFLLRGPCRNAAGHIAYAYGGVVFFGDFDFEPQKLTVVRFLRTARSLRRRWHGTGGSMSGWTWSPRSPTHSCGVSARGFGAVFCLGEEPLNGGHDSTQSLRGLSKIMPN